MKIVKLSSENVKRLTAVAIEPGDAGLVTIGGKNGAGKSSVLDSVAYALGGKELAPAEPIRTGESEAKITVDLGDLVVTRVFRRDRLACDCGADVQSRMHGDAPFEHKEHCASHRFGDTRSTLSVKNRDGASYPSPQKLLDDLYNRLTFDPLAFATEVKDDPKKAADTLRRLAGLDFAKADAERAVLFQERAMTSKSLKATVAQLEGMPAHAEAPAEEIGVDVVKRELEEAEQLRLAADKAEREMIAFDRALQDAQRDIESQKEFIKQMKRQLEEAELNLGKSLGGYGNEHHKFEGILQASKAAKAAVPDVTSINARLAEISAINARVRANAARQEKADRAAELQAEAEAFTEKINALDLAKANALASAPFPVAGLGIADAGPTFGGVPLEQASSSEQLRVSVAIGLALNPKLKVLLVRNGNLLDDGGLKALGEMADAAGAQVWMELVTKDAGGVTVMIEDGHVQ